MEENLSTKGELLFFPDAKDPTYLRWMQVARKATDGKNQKRAALALSSFGTRISHVAQRVTCYLIKPADGSPQRISLIVETSRLTDENKDHFKAQTNRLESKLTPLFPIEASITSAHQHINNPDATKITVIDLAAKQ